MKEITERLQKIAIEVSGAISKLKLDNLEAELDELERKSLLAGFWDNAQSAQATMKRIAYLESRIKPWSEVKNEISEIQELLSTGDSSLAQELNSQLDILDITIEKLKKLLKMGGPYDDHNVVMSIHAGAGGTDAQDWAQMLYRMYVRWAESHKAKIVLVESSKGEEAGIKSVTFTIEYDYAYGKLKGENGVHRLVRLSPYNSDNLRQTSFAKVEVMPKIDAPDEVEIDEKDLKIDVYRSGGKGGQSVNTTDSAVRVTHIPSGIVIAIQNERSQLQNRETCMTILRSKLAQLQIEQHKENLQDLKGPNEQAAWGNQIRSYVLHPYKQVKDLRSRFESSDPEAVLNGQLDPFIDAFLEHTLGADVQQS